MKTSRLNIDILLKEIGGKKPTKVSPQNYSKSKKL